MFNPEEFLKITDTIRRQKKLQTSAGVRTALNRAYFAALVMAKIKLEDLGVFFSTNDEIHKQISDEVKKRDNILGDKLEQVADKIKFTCPVADCSLIPFGKQGAVVRPHLAQSSQAWITLWHNQEGL